MIANEQLSTFHSLLTSRILLH